MPTRPYDIFYMAIAENLRQMMDHGYTVESQRLYEFETASIEASDYPWNTVYARNLRRYLRMYREHTLSYNMAVRSLHLAGWRAILRNNNEIHFTFDPTLSRCTPCSGYTAPAA